MSAVTTNLSYDYESRVSGITYPSSATNTFQYNGNDLRTKKVDSSGTRNYITDGDSPAAAVLSDGLATFTPGLSEHRSSTSSFYHGDALGSTRSQTSSSQSVTDTKRYDAFGMLIASSGSNPTPFGFVGGSQYQTDTDSGLMLLGHRYYDASIGRFISRDPIYAGDNWYAYCENNPLGGTDPEGLYVQITFDRQKGTLVVVDVDTHKTLITIGGVFSGNGSDTNDPKSAGNRGTGTIPGGTYPIGGEVNDPHMGRHFQIYVPKGDGSYTYRGGGSITSPDLPGVTIHRDCFNLHAGNASDGCVTVPSDPTMQPYPRSKPFDKLLVIIGRTRPRKYRPGGKQTSVNGKIDRKIPGELIVK